MRRRRLLGLLALLGLVGWLAGRGAGDGLPVVRVVDGDTLVVREAGREVTVRLLGVDTPETVHPTRPVEAFGREASAFTHRLLDGRRVRLSAPPGHESTDRYGRRLAFVHREPDGLFVNLEIVRQGYGHAYTRYPFAGLEAFRAAEREAREAGRGLWADAEPAGGPTVYVTPAGGSYHRAGCAALGGRGEPLPLTAAVAEGRQPCRRCSPPKILETER